MRRTFIVEVDIDNTEFTSHNAKRLNLGVQRQTEDDIITNLVCDALNTKMLTGASCRPLKLGKLRRSEDPDATT